MKINIAAPITKTNKSHIDKFGFNVVNTNLNSRFMVVDNKHVMFMIVDDALISPSYDSGVWFESEMIGNALQKMFDINHK